MLKVISEELRPPREYWGTGRSGLPTCPFSVISVLPFGRSGFGRKVLNDVERVSPIIIEIGLWEMFVCVWFVLAVFSILAISMVRSKNTRKGKATSSSMELAVKKRKADTLETVKTGKGKQKGHSSEIEEESESEDEEIEAMFSESPKSKVEKWVHSFERQGFHCKQGMKIETFLFTHLIRTVIQDQIL